MNLIYQIMPSPRGGIQYDYDLGQSKGILSQYIVLMLMEKKIVSNNFGK